MTMSEFSLEYTEGTENNKNTVSSRPNNNGKRDHCGKQANSTVNKRQN